MDMHMLEMQDEISKTTLITARNEFIDAFADLEVVVARILRSAGHTPKGEPFRERLKTFRSTEKTPLIAKANHGQRNQIADDIIALLPVPADIVHSRMLLCTINGSPAANFTNVQDVGAEFPTSRVLTAVQLAELAIRIVRYTHRIANLGRINPASSPPPPSPGAAGGP